MRLSHPVNRCAFNNVSHACVEYLPGPVVQDVGRGPAVQDVVYGICGASSAPLEDQQQLVINRFYKRDCLPIFSKFV